MNMKSSLRINRQTRYTVRRLAVVAAVVVAPTLGLAVAESASFTPHTSVSGTFWMSPGNWGPPKGWNGGEIATDVVGGIAAAAIGLSAGARSNRVLRARDQKALGQSVSG